MLGGAGVGGARWAAWCQKQLLHYHQVQKIDNAIEVQIGRLEIREEDLLEPAGERTDSQAIYEPQYWRWVLVLAMLAIGIPAMVYILRARISPDPD